MTISILRRVAMLLSVLFLLSCTAGPVLAETASKAKPLSASDGKKGVLAVGALSAVAAAALILVGGLSAPIAIPAAIVISTVGYLAVKAGLKGIDTVQKANEARDRTMQQIEGNGDTTPMAPAAAGEQTEERSSPFEGGELQIGR